MRNLDVKSVIWEPAQWVQMRKTAEDSPVRGGTAHREADVVKVTGEEKVNVNKKER